MPDAKKTSEEKSQATKNGEAAKGAATDVEQPVVAPPSFNLEDDLVQLEKLNLLKAVTLRMQGGRHPVAAIDALLRRRLDFKREEFQGPYAIRLICTLIMIFLLCSIFWGVLWLFATAFALTPIIKLMSTGIATLMAAAAGIAIFHPASVPDEKLLKEAIIKRMADLKDHGASTAPYPERIPPESRDQGARGDFNSATWEKSQEPEPNSSSTVKESAGIVNTAKKPANAGNTEILENSEITETTEKTAPDAVTPDFSKP